MKSQKEEIKDTIIKDWNSSKKNLLNELDLGSNVQYTPKIEKTKMIENQENY